MLQYQYIYHMISGLQLGSLSSVLYVPANPSQSLGGLDRDFFFGRFSASNLTGNHVLCEGATSVSLLRIGLEISNCNFIVTDIHSVGGDLCLDLPFVHD